MFGLDKKSALGALFIGLSANCLMVGYEIIRSSSNTLFKFAYGPENLSTMMAAIPLSVMLFLYIYGRILNVLGPRKTLFITSLMSGGVIIACYGLIASGNKEATILLYLTRSAYVMILIEQYWSLLNSSIDSDKAKKLYGPLLAISGIGSTFGAAAIYGLSEKMGTENTLIIGALSTIPAAFFSDLAFRFLGEPKPKEAPLHKKSWTKTLGLDMFRANPMLTYLFVIILLTQVLSAVLSLNFQEIMHVSLPDMDQQNAYSGKFFAQLNAIALFFQFVGAPVLLAIMPMGLIHGMIPVLHLGAAAAVIMYPSLGTAAAAYMGFKVIDYSIFRAAKEILYIPLSFDVRYRAKEMIDVFGYRFGKGATGGVISIFQQFGVVFRGIYPVIGLAAAALWLVMITKIFGNKKLTQTESAL